ncbi:MAG: lipid-A-disaccharide synthase [Candidatus Krumholzibacteria bacterium]|jgi:lipid-A-disaccharide synthase|nr:lipid-A-disaccharide synthase [Candidatus Krumholzibacteria bacterium]
MSTILMTCGETSGEENASYLVREILKAAPGCRVMAIGGKRLAQAGAELLFPMEKYAFMGFSEIVGGLPSIMALEKGLKRHLGGGSIDLFIPVDYPGMNMRLAAYARGKGVPVLYFIGPQVWAWGGWRMKKLKKAVDLMAVILPFEEKLYEDAGIPVIFTGHPALDYIDPPPGPKTLPEPGGERRILLFPGSRRQEVRSLLPRMLRAAALIHERMPGARFRLVLAPMIGDEEAHLERDPHGIVTVTRDVTDELARAALVIAASGTATLQAALSGTPAVVVYRTSALTFFLGKKLVRIPHISMPNVLAGAKLLPELLQNETTPENIAEAACGMLADSEAYEKLSGELLELRRVLYKSGGMKELAGVALEMCSHSGRA